MTPISRPLTAMLWLVAAAIMVQAALAGMFITGTANVRLAHTIIGWLLPFAAIAPAVAAFTGAAGRTMSTGFKVGCVLLPVVLWVQEMLGHLPGGVSTAVHVPLGVLLFGGSVGLAVASMRRQQQPASAVGPDRSPSGPPPGS